MSDQATARTWRTCDLKTIAYLLYAGYAVKEVLPDHGRAVFIFDDSPERSNTVLAFQNHRQLVEPMAFIACQNQARDMVTQTVKIPGGLK